MIIRGAAVALLLASAPADARLAAEAFGAGRFAEAAAAGRAEGTTQALILAGRAAAIQAVWQTPDRASAHALLLQAESDFSAALRRDPANLDALLQQGIVVGYRARLENSPGLARQARRAFEAVLAGRPGDALALGAMGGWHGESVATLGKFIAGTALGARETEALRFFDKAMAAPGAMPAVPIFYASMLLAFSDRNADKARGLLAQGLKAKPSDGFEALLQRNARAILAALERGDVATARATARRLSPLGTAA
ncbi:MAG: hypothetical protein KGZ61_11645 [Sandarakinorhabdus sp.]|nr:hypothetical protein [Sandarakinorhabdus sp.]